MRREFSKRTRIEAFHRALGRCEKCTATLFPGRFRFDHIKPDAFGGNPALENCQVICLNCDAPKTYGEDIPAIAKSNRVRAAHIGVKRAKRTIPGRRFNGEPIFSRRLK
jgi:5-methylcytosine-specific restriction protein A